jgi:hypothetical protein
MGTLFFDFVISTRVMTKMKKSVPASASFARFRVPLLAAFAR